MCVHGLIALEMALAVVDTLGSALMIRSLDKLLTVDTGFELAGVVAFRPKPLGTGRSGVAEYRSLYADLHARLATEPGVGCEHHYPRSRRSRPGWAGSWV